MSKRYVFWRAPTGNACRGDDTKHAPSELLAQIGKSAAINTENQVQWQGLGIIWVEAAIRSTVIVLDHAGKECNENDAWSIVYDALLSVIKAKGGKKPVLPSDLLLAANERASEHFRVPLLNYSLITSLSVKSLAVRRIRVGGCIILPLMNRRRYPVPRVPVLTTSRLDTHLNSTNYKWIRVKTTARTIHEAAETALAAVNLLRGYWNLLATFGAWSMNFGTTTQKPLGVVHLGPVHNLYSSDGTPSDIYWYDSDFVEDRELFQPKAGWGELEKERRWAMNRVRHLAYRSDLEDVLIRYAGALDQSNLDLAFLQMWSILERITNTIGANYDETIRRAVWAFSDREIARDYLNALRLHRNQFVHSAKSIGDRQQIAYMIKSVIDPHLVQLLHNDFEVSSFEEYGMCLSLPAELVALQKQQKRVTRAIKLKKGTGRSHGH